MSLDPDTDVDFANSAFMVSPAEFASLETGQPYTYSSGSNGAIGGLTSGGLYYVIVPSNLPDEIQLAASLHDAEQGNFIRFQQYSTLTGGSTTVPISDVNETDGTITFDSNPGFTDGEALTYHAAPGQLIGGLTSGSTYYAIINPASPNTLQLAATAPVQRSRRQRDSTQPRPRVPGVPASPARDRQSERWACQLDPVRV